MLDRGRESLGLEGKEGIGIIIFGVGIVAVLVVVLVVAVAMFAVVAVERGVVPAEGR